MPLRSKVLLALAFVIVGIGVLLMLWREKGIGEREHRIRQLAHELATRAPATPPAPNTPPATPKTDGQVRVDAAMQMLADSQRSMYHSLIYDGEASRDNETLSVLLFRSDRPGPCPDCGSDMSLFEFRDGFALATKRIGFGNLGSDGVFEPQGVAVRQFDKASYLVICRLRYPSQGNEYTKLLIHRISALSDDLVFEERVAGRSRWPGQQDSELRMDWGGDWAFVEVPGEAPEIVLQRRGILNGERIEQVERYRWTDDRYVLVPTPPPLPKAVAPGIDSPNQFRGTVPLEADPSRT